MATAESLPAKELSESLFEPRPALKTGVSHFCRASSLSTYRKPFCWLARGLDPPEWQAWQEEFRNYFYSEECLDTARLLEAVG
jgi:hypothetical protein